MVRNGIAEGSWINKTQKTSMVRGTVAADGSVQLNLAGWTPNDSPVEAILLGRIIDGAISVSGQWSRGGGVAGDWKRTQTATAAPATKDAPKLAASHDGTYNGRLCNQFPDKTPFCWPVALVVRNGIVEGSWISRTKKTSMARGTVAADGSVQLNLTAWAPNGAEAILVGRIIDGTITASGQWSTGGGVAGDWKRSP